METAIREIIKNNSIMKKEYLKPEILVEEILVETMLASSPGTVDQGDGEQEGEFESNSHRGSWGNLWD